jgi:glycopeptide antibiotics resistance protein
LNALEPSDYAAAAALLIALPSSLWLLRQKRAGAARFVWMVALVAVSVPFDDLHPHTHWAKVGWIPFVTPPVKASDIIANVLLYFPLGYFEQTQGSRRRMMARAFGEAMLIAFLTEWTQLYSHSRFPSATDIVCDGLGAVLGAWTRHRTQN